MDSRPTQLKPTPARPIASRMAWKGLDVVSSAPRRTRLDVRMGDEPTRTVQHEGEADFSHFDGRYYVQISLRLTSAITVPADARLPEIATIRYGSEPRL